jgi:hypothetical protein
MSADSMIDKALETPQPRALTPTGVAILTSMNGDYRRKVVKALEALIPEFDHLDGAEYIVSRCIEAVRNVALSE